MNRVDFLLQYPWMFVVLFGVSVLVSLIKIIFLGAHREKVSRGFLASYTLEPSPTALLLFNAVAFSSFSLTFFYGLLLIAKLKSLDLGASSLGGVAILLTTCLMIGVSKLFRNPPSGQRS